MDGETIWQVQYYDPVVARWLNWSNTNDEALADALLESEMSHFHAGVPLRLVKYAGVVVKTAEGRA